MNLHALVAPLISAVNPFTPGILRQSTGYTTQADGSQAPSYTETPVSLQIQPISGGDLQKLDGLNLQAVNQSVYLSGTPDAVNRVNRKGGDLLIINKQTWLVVTVLEDWPGWVKLAVVLQNGG